MPGARNIREEADAALEHTIDLLGSGRVALGPAIDWHRDFKSGYRWPLTFYQDVEVIRWSDDSDAKVPWELSRCHHMLALARAASLWRDERYAHELECQFESWLTSNPPGFGINWCNTMEVAIRAVNWVWALATLESWRPVERELRARITRSLQIHARHIARNLEGSPNLRGNHYLADVLGLLVLSVVLRDDASSSSWSRVARRGLEREIRGQVLADGVSFEASLAYHGLVLEMLLLADWIARAGGRGLSSGFTAQLARMTEVVRAVRHPDGRVPQFGDCDSGRVLPTGASRPPSMDHLLGLGAALLGGVRPCADPPSDEVAWTFGLAAWERCASLPPTTLPRRLTFERGGLYVLEGGGAHLVVRTGDVGQNGNGGHAHNDLLSYELSYGTPFVVDSGTYCYSSDPATRNQFRASRAHNVVVVDDQEINPIVDGELFRLTQVAWSRAVALDSREASVRLTASHDGYRRLPGCPIHEREFSLARETGCLNITDRLRGSGRHDAVSYIHLAPGTAVTQIAHNSFELVREQVGVSLVFDSSVSVELCSGWVSDSFGARKGAPIFKAHIGGLLPTALLYSFSPS